MAGKSKINAPDTTHQAETNNDAAANDALVQKAVAEGRSLIDQGKSKIDAAMAIYRMIENLPQQTIIQAFIDGATLTEKGALTYWYNCRRKLARERQA